MYVRYTKIRVVRVFYSLFSATRNALEATTIESIRNLEHRDADGNIISELFGGIC